MLNLCFVAEIVLFVITDKMIDGMFQSFHTDENGLYCDLGRK